MSEFTYGNIIRTVDKTKLVENLPTGTPTLKLSEVWFAFFTPEDGEFVASQQLETLSSHCPILYFTNLEDHGWGFQIFNEGVVVSNLQVMYDSDEEVDENTSVEAFRLIGLKDEQIEAIEVLLAGTLSFDEVDDFIAVDKFKEILGIEEMNWISYDRIEGRDEIEYVSTKISNDKAFDSAKQGGTTMQKHEFVLLTPKDKDKIFASWGMEKNYPDWVHNTFNELGEKHADNYTVDGIFYMLYLMLASDMTEEKVLAWPTLQMYKIDSRK